MAWHIRDDLISEGFYLLATGRVDLRSYLDFTTHNLNIYKEEKDQGQKDLHSTKNCHNKPKMLVQIDSRVPEI